MHQNRDHKYACLMIGLVLAADKGDWTLEAGHFRSRDLGRILCSLPVSQPLGTIYRGQHGLFSTLATPYS